MNRCFNKMLSLRKLFTWQLSRLDRLGKFRGCPLVGLKAISDQHGCTSLLLSKCTVREVTDQSGEKPPIIVSSEHVGLGLGEEDVLTKKLQAVKSFGKLMDVANSHYSIMNNKHLVVTFEVMYSFLRSSKNPLQCEVDRGEINKLCKQVLKRVRHFSPHETITILKTLTMLNVPSNSAVVQSIYQMIRHTINDLQLSQLTFLHFLLEKHESTPLSDALKLAIPIVLQSNLDIQMDPGKVNEVLECLKVLSNQNPSISAVEKLCGVILPKCKELNCSRALQLISALTLLPIKPSNYHDLLSSATEVIVQKIDKLSYNECVWLLRHLHEYPELEDRTLLTTLSNKANCNQWDLTLLSHLLNVYTKYKFISTEVLDLTAHLMNTQPNIVANDKNVSILTLAEAFVQADYLPGKFLHSILDSREKLALLKHHVPHLYVKLVALLVLLDAAPTSLIQSVCSEDFIARAYNTARSKGRNKVLLYYISILNQHIHLYLQNYTGPFLSKILIEEAITVRGEEETQPADPVLMNFLDIGLGGPRFVLNGLWTRLGHFIDHVIVMRKGDFPVAINATCDDHKNLHCPDSENGLKYIEDLQVSEDAKILAILIARNSWMSKDPLKPTAWVSFQQRSLLKMGYNTIILGPPVEENVQDRGEMDHEGF